MSLVLGGAEKRTLSRKVMGHGQIREPQDRTCRPGICLLTYSFSRGADGPGTAWLPSGASFTFFTSRTRGSLGPSRALMANTRETE